MKIFFLTMEAQEYLYLLKDQMEIDSEYQKSISKIVNTQVPFYNNKNLYQGAIKSISEKSGIPEEEINFFIYDQEFGKKSNLTIECFIKKWKK